MSFALLSSGLGEFKTGLLRAKLACKAGGFAGGMIRKQRLRTTGRHFERANKGETGERKKVKREGEGEGVGWGVGSTACPEIKF